MQTVYETLENLEVRDKVTISVFNKQDKVTEPETLRDFKSDYSVKISAKQGQGLDELLALIEKILNERQVLVEKVFSYNDAGKIQQIRKYGQLLEEKYLENGIYVKAYVPAEIKIEN